MSRMERMPVRPILLLWTPSMLIPGTVVTMWNSVLREGFGETVLTWGQVMNPEDRYTAVKRRGYKARYAQQHRLATVTDRAKWRAKLEESWRPITLALVVQNKKSQSLRDQASSWWKSIYDVSMALERVDDLADSICD